MTVLRLFLIMALAALTANAQPASSNATLSQAESVPPSCQVTVRPTHAFTPPAPYEVDPVAFWWGTEKLWTFVGEPAIWPWLPHKPGHEHEVQPLTNKLFWMSVNHNWRAEPHPPLTVTGRRLDGSAPPLLVDQAQNAFFDPAAAMVIGVYVPTPGCWEITGEYKGEKLSFVVWVRPSRDPKLLSWR
jgi:hypothetical protein